MKNKYPYSEIVVYLVNDDHNENGMCEAQIGYLTGVNAFKAFMNYYDYV